MVCVRANMFKSKQGGKASVQFILPLCASVGSDRRRNTKRGNFVMQKSFGNCFAGCVSNKDSYGPTWETINTCYEKKQPMAGEN